MHIDDIVDIQDVEVMIASANEYMKLATQQTLRVKELEKENAKLKEKLAKFQSLLNGDYL